MSARVHVYGLPYKHVFTSGRFLPFPSTVKNVSARTRPYVHADIGASARTRHYVRADAPLQHSFFPHEIKLKILKQDSKDNFESKN
jgi:hypothetical protein